MRSLSGACEFSRLTAAKSSPACVFGCPITTRSSRLHQRRNGTALKAIAAAYADGLRRRYSQGARWGDAPTSIRARRGSPRLLLAQTRQADRDKVLAIADAQQRDAIAHESLAREDAASAQGRELRRLLESNTALTAEVERLMREIHGRMLAERREAGGVGS
jgi:hypothetical protein